jgi:hypothetical protein
MILNQFFSSFPPMSFEIGSWGILEGVFESIKDKKLDGFIFKKVS